ncbi:TMV resistance protein N-like [Pyrus x bretschneideri]|uniref:TMV resistance protein N-like n=1 Tax=Pyrus x bretschneideri TaxID=225117 RepID=UPI00202E8871|nr:TMV resistance protein N-like [Pyrus x bretschneideri]
MAWTIVRQESEKPGLRSRLWLPNDIFHVFMTNTDLPNLKYIDLGFSKKLINTPDFSGIPNLVELALGHCKNLVEIHPSIAVLKRLKHLHIHGCNSIKSLPSEVEMDSLESLNLNGCSNVRKIPEFGEQMKNLSKLHLGGTAIEKMPSSIEHLVGLKDLNLFNCKNLLNLPRAICNLKSLRRLCMGQCSKIDKLPGDMDHLETLVLGATLTEPIGGMKNLKHLQLCGSYAKARDGWRLLRILGLGKSAPDPPPCPGLMFSSLNRLCTLRTINLRDCKLCEGDIPDDIGCLSFLERLNLGGNNFVSLPESIRCLSKLCYLVLSSCKSLQKLPPLPFNGKLHVNVDDCTSLRSLSDTSKLSSRFTNLYDFSFTCRNCIALVQDEAWTNTILSRIVKFATQNKIVIPGSEIPEWFSNQSVGHSVNVELPPPSCTNWLGIAFCVVFEDPKENLANPAALHCYSNFEFEFLSEPFYRKICSNIIGPLVSEHLWVFYLSREACHHKPFLFETYFGGIGVGRVKADLNKVKKCGARLVYKQDLEELNHTLKILKRTHEYRDEATPSEPGSASFSNTKQIRKKHCY